MNGMAHDGAMRRWIVNQISEARDLAAMARATSADLDDHVLAAATEQLADDLEAFAHRFVTRLADLDGRTREPGGTPARRDARWLRSLPGWCP
jgi:thermostable 8-oxoguanine DNA glycosylase